MKNRYKTRTGNSSPHGTIRHKRSDTLIRTLRREYGEHFAQGFRGDAKLEAVLRKEKVQSLSEYLRQHRPIPVRNRFATARDTARALGVSKSRTDVLIHLVKRSIPISPASRSQHNQLAGPVVSAAKAGNGSTHGEFAIKKAKTKR